jgi:chromosome segregation ATPase
MQKFLNGQLVDLTQEEINQRNQDIENWNNSAFDRSMQSLRSKRNNLLAQTDYLALSDQTMTAEMTTYRQALRDITNGLTTVADVEAVVFPEKPGA